MSIPLVVLCVLLAVWLVLMVAALAAIRLSGEIAKWEDENR
jgi:hypothetical protein